MDNIRFSNQQKNFTRDDFFLFLNEIWEKHFFPNNKNHVIINPNIYRHLKIIEIKFNLSECNATKDIFDLKEEKLF